MAQRHEIAAWVNPSAWDDEDEARRVIDEIESSGSDEESEWVRIAGGGAADVEAAEARDEDRIEDRMSGVLAAYRSAVYAADLARDDLYEAIRAEHGRGVTAYRLAQVTGLAERHVGRIVAG